MEVKVKKADIRNILRATFPEYKGRKFFVIPKQEVTVYNLSYDGGTRSRYRSATLEGEKLGNLDKYNTPYGLPSIGEGQTTAIPQGTALVEHTIFQGQDAGLRIYIHPNDMPKLLPEQ